MKQRILTTIIALLSLAMGAEAQVTTATLEIYTATKTQAEIKEMSGLLAAIVLEKAVTVTTSDGVTTFKRNGTELFKATLSGKYPSVTVPRSVTSEQDFSVTVTKTTCQELVSQGYTDLAKLRTVNVKFQITINSTNFPDATFLQYVSDNFDSESGNKGRLTKAECGNVTEIDVLSQKIGSLKGVEYFTALTRLGCYDNRLTTLNVTKNTALEYLNFGRNQLTSIDVSKNTALTELYCQINQLTTLDVSKNGALTVLWCHENQIGAEAMGALVDGLPTVSGGRFRVYDTSSVTEGNVIYKSQVKQAKDKGWSVYNATGSAYEGVEDPAIAIDATNFPDANFRAYVSSKCDTNGDGVLSKEECENVTEIDVNSKGITNLKGVEYFTKLEVLWCNLNQLTSLDVSKNTALTYLNCSSNLLTMIDVSKNTALTELDCSHNQLTELDASKNTALTRLKFYSNLLTMIDVSKNTALTYLDCAKNQLTKLDVSKNTALTGVSCDQNELETLNLSGLTKLNQIGCNNNHLTTLDVSDCAALTFLYCYNNQLTTLDVSKNNALKILSCYNNQLTELDVSGLKSLSELSFRNNPLITLKASGCTSLESLSCSDNKTLTTIDASGCTALTEIYCYDLQLTALDVSGCTALTYLNCYYNQLTSLDVSDCTALTKLYCNDNQLTELDLSNNKALMSLSCYQNQLTTLVISYNPLWEYLACYNNRIKGKDMWNIVNSLPILPEGTTNYFDPIDISSSEEQNVITALQVAAANAKGWAVMAYDGHSFVDYDGIHIPGDANGDGEVTADDVNVVCAYILGLLPDNQPFDEESADVSNDGTVDIVDVTRLIELVKAPL